MVKTRRLTSTALILIYLQTTDDVHFEGWQMSPSFDFCLPGVAGAVMNGTGLGFAGSSSPETFIHLRLPEYWAKPSTLR
jgi:hypothetical protein